MFKIVVNYFFCLFNFQGDTAKSEGTKEEKKKDKKDKNDNTLSAVSWIWNKVMFVIFFPVKVACFFCFSLHRSLVKYFQAFSGEHSAIDHNIGPPLDEWARENYKTIKGNESKSFKYPLITKKVTVVLMKIVSVFKFWELYVVFYSKLYMYTVADWGPLKDWQLTQKGPHPERP